ncbi:MAG TPA: hypothetical protein DCM87_10065 [Planctomycetes bacterium]|nr:hypothetical protein [Planctomycetota bacterium]
MRILLASLLCCGCADFSVAPAGGRDAPGVHFFLPKPYVLFWWEREIMWKSGTPVHSLVPRCQVILLPDVSQRYAITQHAWCAKGDFSYQLKDGWRLEMINGTMDTSEFLRAVREPATAAVEGAFPRAGASADGAPALPPPILYELVWRDDARSYEFRRVALEGLAAVPPE